MTKSSLGSFSELVTERKISLPKSIMFVPITLSPTLWVIDSDNIRETHLSPGYLSLAGGKIFPYQGN